MEPSQEEEEMMTTTKKTTTSRRTETMAKGTTEMTSFFPCSQMVPVVWS
jgi:hypothetical protein